MWGSFQLSSTRPILSCLHQHSAKLSPTAQSCLVLSFSISTSDLLLCYSQLAAACLQNLWWHEAGCSCCPKRKNETGVVLREAWGCFRGRRYNSGRRNQAGLLNGWIRVRGQTSHQSWPLLINLDSWREWEKERKLGERQNYRKDSKKERIKVRITEKNQRIRESKNYRNESKKERIRESKKIRKESKKERIRESKNYRNESKKERIRESKNYRKESKKKGKNKRK